MQLKKCKDIAKVEKSFGKNVKSPPSTVCIPLSTEGWMKLGTTKMAMQSQKPPSDSLEQATATQPYSVHDALELKQSFLSIFILSRISVAYNAELMSGIGVAQ
jgi:hypothetical protein